MGGQGSSDGVSSPHSTTILDDPVVYEASDLSRGRHSHSHGLAYLESKSNLKNNLSLAN